MAILRRSKASWKLGLKSGGGTMVVGEGVFSGKFSYSSRFEEGEGTNPEELLAAAHAGCFSMYLSAILEKAGYQVEEIDTEETLHLELKEEGPRITKAILKVKGKVKGIDEQTFLKFAEDAKENCPVSVALKGIPEVEVQAELV